MQRYLISIELKQSGGAKERLIRFVILSCFKVIRKNKSAIKHYYVVVYLCFFFF